LQGEEKWSYVEDNVSLSQPEASLPAGITQGVLWRVAQSQCDPLGLLCVYMVQWKLLMRRVTMKEKARCRDNALDPEKEKEFQILLRDMDELRKIIPKKHHPQRRSV
jgi:hypothetical protein